MVDLFRRLSNQLKFWLIYASCTSPAWALKAPAEPKISGLEQGQTNWFKVAEIIIEEFANLGALGISVAITLASLLGLLVAVCLEVFTDKGSGKHILFCFVIMVIAMTVSAYLVTDILAQTS